MSAKIKKQRGETPRPISADTVGRIRRIVWFANCGKPITDDLSRFPFPIDWAFSWTEALKFGRRDSWGIALYEAQRINNEFLFDNCRREFNKWDVTVDAADALLATTFEPALLSLSQQHELPEEFVMYTRNSVRGGILKEAYSEFGPPPFCAPLLKIYELGHLPCGWIGDYPQGTLIVF